MELSYVQNQILTLLLRKESSRYTDIIPENIDRNLFNYHLKFLLEKGYILKVENLYKLSDFGKKYVQRIDATGNFKSYFRFSVLCYVVDEKNSKILLHKRKRHPYYNDVGVISGKVLYGEKIEQAASRKLNEETGLKSESFSLIGVHRKTRLDQNKRIIEDTLYHCCVSRNYSGKLKAQTEFGENFWSTFEELKDFEKNNITYSSKALEVIDRVQNGNSDLFYLQEESTLQKI